MDGKPVWVDPELSGVDPISLANVDKLNERIESALRGNGTLELGPDGGIPPLLGIPNSQIAVMLDNLSDDAFVVIHGVGGMKLSELKSRLTTTPEQQVPVVVGPMDCG